MLAPLSQELSETLELEEKVKEESLPLIPSMIPRTNSGYTIIEKTPKLHLSVLMDQKS